MSLSQFTSSYRNWPQFLHLCHRKTQLFRGGEGFTVKSKDSMVLLGPNNEPWTDSYCRKKPPSGLQWVGWTRLPISQIKTLCGPSDVCRA